jgi:hypothetical protein
MKEELSFYCKEASAKKNMMSLGLNMLLWKRKASWLRQNCKTAVRAPFSGIGFAFHFCRNLHYSCYYCFKLCLQIKPYTFYLCRTLYTPNTIQISFVLRTKTEITSLCLQAIWLNAPPVQEKSFYWFWKAKHGAKTDALPINHLRCQINIKVWDLKCFNLPL